MSKDENANDDNDNQEDIRRLENYEQRSKINHFETLKNEDILNYIKNIEQNCRLEVSSGDEDYAGTKRSSNCSVRCSDTRFRSSKKGKSRVSSERNKNVTSTEKRIKQFCGRKKNASNYCCSSRKSHFCSNPDVTIQENSRKDFNASAKFIYQYQKSSNKRDLYKYHEFPPRFYGWYSRRNRKTWPAVTETTSLEIVKDRSQHATLDSGINGSKNIDGKSPLKARMFKSLRRRKLDNSIYTYPDIPLKTNKRDIYKRKEDPRIKESKEKSNISSFISQRPLDKLYPGQERTDKLSARSYQISSNSKEHKGLISAYRYSASRARQPTSWNLGSRSNRLTARLPAANSLSRGRIFQRDNEIMRPPLKASSPISRAPSIDESYRERPRESRHKNNTNQRRREPESILGERGSSCCHRFLTGSGKVCEVIRKGKQLLGYWCEDTERNETADCATYCRCPENVNDPTCDCWMRCESVYRPLETSGRETLSKSPGNNVEEESDFHLSMKESVPLKTSHNYLAFDKFNVSTDIKAKDYSDKIELEDLEYPQVSFPNDWTYQKRRLHELARECKKSSNDLKREARRKKITERYPSDKGLSNEIKTSSKLVPGDFMRYDVLAESTCQCREPFHDPPAACLTDSCSCIGSNNRAENNNDDSDSSRRISVACCCCSSASSCNNEDPVKKLETFCEKVKAINQNTFRSTCCNAARINARQYSHGDNNERDPSEISAQMRTQAAGSIKKEWLDPTRLRIGKPKQSRDGTNLEKILIYPPRGENGPPLTLYKKSSNVNCRVKGDGNAGFRYSVTYVQKFVSPTWMPSLASEIPSRKTDVECDCSTDYG